MLKNEAIATLENNAAAIKDLGATALYLFGSTARDETKATSDIDIFIDYDDNSRFNALDLMSIKLLLEEKLKTAVDITTRDGLHPRLKDRIEESAIRVF
ncbi:nucleotidyltransferase family protein [Pararhizobium arenae]|uniref:nucleotidyltransferase family protein n=1 Tax=Pararhizobium arenae TaxID=1856850 RepID=UPI00094B27D9|nr:nucleotidyltransferase domain-containing protein [Pararhizobium arenae]